MSKEAKECSCLSGMLVNQWVTSGWFFYWLSFVFFLISELTLSRICLLTFPSSLFAGFMRRHVRVVGEVVFMLFQSDKGLLFCDLFCAVVDIELLGDGFCL